MLIAIIEDEEDLLELMEFNLQKEGFEVVGFLNSKKVKDFIVEENPDLLIVDRNLPFIEGAEFVKTLKDEGYQIPVIFVTAKVDENDVLQGFEAGADDYIKKPFSMKEFIARVKAVLKRYNKTDEKISYKNKTLDIKNHKIITQNQQIPLTPNELKLLTLFFKNPNKIFEKSEIAEEFEISQNSVNVLINRLNHKIDIIEAKRGVGYKLK
ncbi:MAG: response regulator transcription factor [Epsilonproteobacteria bacterium]|nr:response regulator transcription factor [Campylobacterota bacterium]